MKKQFMSLLLCGAMVFLTGTYTSCSYDDDELKSRLTVLEIAINDLKVQLSRALTTGASIIRAEKNEDTGEWTLDLSDGTTIVISGSLGGGSNVTVVENESNFTITVNGTAYVIPKGAAVNSLVYRPEYADGIVNISNDGAVVKFLATPAISANALANATFDIADAYELKTRGGNRMFKVNGDVTLDGEFLAVKLKALRVEADKKYSVALLMTFSGTTISSNYFTVEVGSDFYFDAEQIGGYSIKPEYAPNALPDNFHEITIKGLDFLKANFNFKDIFSQLPDNAEFVLAPKNEQPGGHAQEKWDILNKNLTVSGAWAFNERLGTSFNENVGRKGFLLNIISDDVVKAKIYVMINDELANVDFVDVFTVQAEAEWGGHERFINMGAQTIDMQKTFNDYINEYPLIYNGHFFENWKRYMVTLRDPGDVIYNDDEKLVLGTVGEEYIRDGKSRGIYWFNHGFGVYVPVALCTEGVYIDSNGKKISGGENYGYDLWGRGIGQGAPWNFVFTEDGKVIFPATYTGYGVRLGIGASYEYAYGDKRLSAADQMGLFFFNRRVAPAGATMPAAKD